jgi:hypothetical protein
MSDQIISNDRVLLPSTEARKIAGFSRQHLQRLLRDKRIEGIKLAHDWLVYEDSLKAFLAQPRKPGPKGPRKKSLKDSPEITSSDNAQHNENRSDNS